MSNPPSTHSSRAYSAVVVGVVVADVVALDVTVVVALDVTLVVAVVVALVVSVVVADEVADEVGVVVTVVSWHVAKVPSRNESIAALSVAAVLQVASTRNPESSQPSKPGWVPRV